MRTAVSVDPQGWAQFGQVKMPDYRCGMVYLLHKHFGRDGREDGEALLQRRSGQQDNPRILQACPLADQLGWESLPAER